MENEVKDILFNKLKDRIDVCEINADEEKYHKYILIIKPSNPYGMSNKIELTQEEFHKIRVYLRRS